MNGLVQRNEQSLVYLQIFEGYLSERYKEEKEGFKQVKTIHPKTHEELTSYVKQYKSLEAKFQSIEWYSKTFPDGGVTSGWNLYLSTREDNQIDVRLQLPLQSPVTKIFMKLADNINFNLPVEISTWLSKDHETQKVKTAFMVRQEGEALKWFYTKENLPQPKKLLSGKWDYTAQEEFLLQNMHDVIIPRLQAITKAQVNVPESDVQDVEENEIPF